MRADKKYKAPAKDAPVCEGRMLSKTFDGDTAECSCGARVPVWIGRLLSHEPHKKQS